MDRAYLHGQMGEDMKVNMLMIKKKALEFIRGRTEDNMPVNGKMVNSMAKEYIKM